MTTSLYFLIHTIYKRTTYIPFIQIPNSYGQYNLEHIYKYQLFLYRFNDQQYLIIIYGHTNTNHILLYINDN